MNQIKHYGQMLGGGVWEANAKKMHAAQTDGSSLGPSQMDQDAIKQRGAIAQQAASQGEEQAAQAQAAQSPVLVWKSF
jgi:hypothetical protein